MGRQHINIDTRFLNLACGPPRLFHGLSGLMWTPVEMFVVAIGAANVGLGAGATSGLFYGGTKAPRKIAETQELK